MCFRSAAWVLASAAINALVQSGASVAFGIVALLMYQCVLYPTPIQMVDPTQVPTVLTSFSNSFYLQYFHSQNNCIARQVDFWRDVNDTKTGVVTKSYQVQGIFIGYLADNSLWLICSILLLAGLAAKSRFIYAVQSISQMLVMLYDIIMIVLFALDFKSYNEFLGNPNTPWITKETMLINIIVMLLIATRFVFFFIFNITTFVMVWQVINSLGKPRKPQPFTPPPLVAQQQHPMKPAAYIQPNYQQPTTSSAQYHYRQGPPPPGNNAGVARYPDVVGQPYPKNHNRFDSSESSDEMTTSSRKQPYGKRLSDPYSGNRMSSNKTRFAEDQHQQKSSKTAQKYPKIDYDDQDSSSSYENTPRQTSRKVENSSRPIPVSKSNVTIASPPAEILGSAGGTRYPAPAVVSRNSSNSSRGGSEALKNQRPWSYISPNDLPSSPNRLNAFYVNNLNANKNDRPSASARALPSLQDDDETDPMDYRRSQQQPRNIQREYGLRDRTSSLEFQEPLLPVTSPTPKVHYQKNPNPSRSKAPVTENAYANLQKPETSKNKSGRKNVRFDQRAQSLDYLETTFPFDSPAESRRGRLKKPNNQDQHKRSGSGEQLATDEFSFYYDGREERKAPKPTRPLKRTDSKSSPNLVFDPTSNTVSIVYGNRDPYLLQPRPPCRREGRKLVHVRQCDGRSCLLVHLTETSI